MAEEEQWPRAVVVRLNKQAVTAPAIQAMQRTSEVMSAALPAIEAATWEETSVLGGFGLRIESQQPLEERRAAHKAWLLSAGFRELVGGVRQSLEAAYLYLSVITAGNRSTTIEEFESEIATYRRLANRMSFPDLIEAVEAMLDQPLNFADQFGSMQRVRNCLEHRDGIVGQADADAEGRLILTLPSLTTEIENEDGVKELKAGDYIRKESLVRVRLIDKLRSFAVGERVEFDATEFHEIAFSCWFFASDLSKKLPAAPPDTVRVD